MRVAFDQSWQQGLAAKFQCLIDITFGHLVRIACVQNRVTADQHDPARVHFLAVEDLRWPEQGNGLRGERG